MIFFLLVPLRQQIPDGFSLFVKSTTHTYLIPCRDESRTRDVSKRELLRQKQTEFYITFYYYYCCWCILYWSTEIIFLFPPTTYLPQVSRKCLTTTTAGRKKGLLNLFLPLSVLCTVYTIWTNHLFRPIACAKPRLLHRPLHNDVIVTIFQNIFQIKRLYYYYYCILTQCRYPKLCIYTGYNDDLFRNKKKLPALSCYCDELRFHGMYRIEHEINYIFETSAETRNTNSEIFVVLVCRYHKKNIYFIYIKKNTTYHYETLLLFVYGMIDVITRFTSTKFTTELHLHASINNNNIVRIFTSFTGILDFTWQPCF